MPWRKAIKVITFDLDNTLWPEDPLIPHAEQLTYQWLVDHAPKITQLHSLEFLRQHRNHLFDNDPCYAHQISAVRLASIRMLAIEAGYPEVSAQAISQQAFDYFLEHRQQVSFYEGAVEAIERLSKHYVIGAITNGNADIFQTEVGRHFAFSVSAEQHKASKPLPAIFEVTLKKSRQHCQPLQVAEQILHVGDDYEKDICGAKAAGFSALLIDADGKTADNKKPRQSGADAILQSVSELPDFIFSR